MKTKTYKSAIKKIVLGLLLILAALLILYFTIGNPFDELSLIRHGQTAPGYITDCTEGIDVDDNYYHYCDYTFTLPDGRTFNTQSTYLSGELEDKLTNLTSPYPIEAEYLADNPTISKIKDTGNTNLFDWMWRKLGFGIFFLAVFAIPGLIFLKRGVQELMSDY